MEHVFKDKIANLTAKIGRISTGAFKPANEDAETVKARVEAQIRECKAELDKITKENK